MSEPVDDGRPTIDELRERISITPSEWSWKATTKGSVSDAPALKEGDRIVLEDATGWVDSIKIQDGGAVLNVKLDSGHVRKVADRSQPTLDEQDQAEPTSVDIPGILSEHIATCDECVTRDGKPDGGLLQPCPDYLSLVESLGISETWPEPSEDRGDRWADLPVVDNELADVESAED